jgi:flagellar biosynthesis protein
VKERKTAAALKYDNNYNVPIVTAIGFGQIAERIVKEAKKNDVHIVENKELMKNLSKVPIGQSIPEELYEPIAEIIAYIYKIDEKAKK